MSDDEFEAMLLELLLRLLFVRSPDSHMVLLPLVSQNVLISPASHYLIYYYKWRDIMNIMNANIYETNRYYLHIINMEVKTPRKTAPIN